MDTDLFTWYNSPEISNKSGWRFRIECCGFCVIAASSFATQEDAEGFANNLINKLLNPE